MDFTLINQAHRVLTACGARPVVRDNAVAVPIQKKFLMPMTLPQNQALNFIKEITGDTIWAMRAISSDGPMLGLFTGIVGVRCQIQLPSGRFLFGGNGIDVGQFSGAGSYRYLVQPEEDCEPGSTIQVTLSDYVGLQAPIVVNMVFEGSYKFYLRGGQLVKPGPSANSIPRYQRTPNQNILAPCWMGGYGPSTPQGYEDSVFTYSSPTIVVPLAGPITATLKIPIDPPYDFICRRLLFDVTADSTVATGIFLGRVRSGTGYALNDQFIDIARYLNGLEWPKGWRVRGGDAIFVDLALADATGSGSMYIQCHFEGARRRKAA
jgi:hypothetical protein